MEQRHLQYNPSQCIECECQSCLLCPMGCISLPPLLIMGDCIECESCIGWCPKGEKVLRMAYNDELGGGWISPFGYLPSKDNNKGESSESTPSTPSKDESTSENPSKPSESESSTESSTGQKDNEQESSQESNNGDSSTESKEEQSEATQNPSYTPADKAKLEALKNALLSAPPPTRYNQAQKS